MLLIWDKSCYKRKKNLRSVLADKVTARKKDSNYWRYSQPRSPPLASSTHLSLQTTTWTPSVHPTAVRTELLRVVLSECLLLPHYHSTLSGDLEGCDLSGQTCQSFLITTPAAASLKLRADWWASCSKKKNHPLNQWWLLYFTLNPPSCIACSRVSSLP